MYVNSKKACEFYNCTPSTLVRWAKEGKLTYKQTPGGHYRYWADPESNKPNYTL